MDFSKEDLADLQRTVDKGRARYEKTQKAKATKKRAESERRCRELGLKVIKTGYNAPE